MATTHNQPRTQPTSSSPPSPPFTETRDLYRQKYEAQLREWEAKVEEMRARADKLDAQARLDMRPHFDTVETQWQTVRSKLQDLGDAAEEGWEDMKRNTEKAWNDFKSAVEGAYDAFRGHGRSQGRNN
jgi:uncharacterized coiled-coil DUF342 family protein